MWVTVPPGIGYGALAALVGAESAGLPVPGETALVAASMLAAAGHLSLSLVIAVATIAGAAGDNVGYAMGRHLGRDALVSDRGLLRHHRRAAIERADRFFARHGLWAVFLARWLPGVRVVGTPEANAVFAALPHEAIGPLQEWSFFWVWDEPTGVVRWMTSFDTTTDDVDRFVSGVAAVLAGRNDDPNDG